MWHNYFYWKFLLKNKPHNLRCIRHFTDACVEHRFELALLLNISKLRFTLLYFMRSSTQCLISSNFKIDEKKIGEFRFIIELIMRLYFYINLQSQGRLPDESWTNAVRKCHIFVIITNFTQRHWFSLNVWIEHCLRRILASVYECEATHPLKQ